MGWEQARQILSTLLRLLGDDAVQPKLKLHFIFFELELNLADVKEELKFLLRLNRLLAPILLVAFAGVKYLVWRDLQKTYEGATVEIARAMLETAHAMRAYTTQEIAPLLEGDPGLPDRTAKRIHEILGADLSRDAQKRTGVRGANAGPALQPALGSIEDRLRQELVTPLERLFAPQTVPAYAATRAFGFFRQKFPEFFYKEAVLNPTNPSDRSTDWEADMVTAFKMDPAKTELIGHRETTTGPGLYVATPIRVDDPTCLRCHDTAETAPPEVIKRYGPANGFGWKLNEVIGARIVSVPATFGVERFNERMNDILRQIGVIFAALFVAFNLIAFRYQRGARDATATSPRPPEQAMGEEKR